MIARLHLYRACVWVCVCVHKCALYESSVRERIRMDGWGKFEEFFFLTCSMLMLKIRRVRPQRYTYERMCLHELANIHTNVRNLLEMLISTHMALLLWTCTNTHTYKNTHTLTLAVPSLTAAFRTFYGRSLCGWWISGFFFVEGNCEFLSLDWIVWLMRACVWLLSTPISLCWEPNGLKNDYFSYKIHNFLYMTKILIHFYLFRPQIQ